MKLSSTIGLGLCGALAFASVAAAQPPAPGGPGMSKDDNVAVAIVLQAGGDAYRFTGQASCLHEPNGYIYTVPARLWKVEQRDASRHVSLTFWQPANASGAMFSLRLQGHGKTYAANTIKTKDGGSPAGSGEVTFAKSGAGGTFTVNATAANGAKISGTIKCSAFRALVAEGGN